MMTVKECLQCDTPFERHYGESFARFAARRFCGVACSHASRPRPKPEGGRRTTVIEDLEWIVGTDHPDRIALRLGFTTAESLVRKLRSWGRQDLVRGLGVGDDGQA